MSMHFLSFMRAREGRDPQVFQQWYLGEFAPRLGRDQFALRRHLVNVCVTGPTELRTVHDSDDPRARYEIVDEMWFDSSDEFRRAMLGPGARDLADAVDVMNCYQVSDTVVLDRRRDTPPRTEGYKLLRELLFHEDLPDAAAKRLWTHHGKLALQVHVGMTHYLQHWIEEVLTSGTPRVRGISQLFFPSRDELVQRYYESPRGRAEILHDTGHFIERRLPRVYSHEHVLK